MSLRSQSGDAHSWWVTMGGGLAMHGPVLGMTAGIDYCYQIDRSLISARLIGATNENPTVKQISPSATTYKLTDYGLLYGPLWPSGSWRMSVGAGIGLVRVTTESRGAMDTQSGVALPLEAQVSYRFTSFAGAGLYAYGSINGVRTFGGVLLVVQLGSFSTTD